LKDIFYI